MKVNITITNSKKPLKTVYAGDVIIYNGNAFLKLNKVYNNITVDSDTKDSALLARLDNGLVYSLNEEEEAQLVQNSSVTGII